MKKKLLIMLTLGFTFCGSNSNNDLLSNFQVDVSGLDGELIISNNQSDAIKITKNGIVRLPASWSSNSRFNLRVDKEPCSQRCTIDEMNGTVSKTKEKVLSVSCKSKSWETLQGDSLILNKTNTGQHIPRLAMNKYGDILSTWGEDINGLTKATYFNRSWIFSAPREQDNRYFSFLTPNRIYYQATLSDSGDASIIWDQYPSTQSAKRNLYSGDFQDGWKFPSINEPLGLIGYSIGSDPVLKSNKFGEKIAAWLEFDNASSTGNIKYAKFQNLKWTQPQTIQNIVNLKLNTVFDLALNDDGKVVAAWTQTDGSVNQVAASEYDGVSWTTPVGLTATTNGNSIPDVKVALNNMGDIYVAWYTFDSNSSASHIFATEKHTSLDWKLPVDLSIDNSLHPSLDLNDAGHVVLAFHSFTAGQGQAGRIALLEKQSASWGQPTFFKGTESTVKIDQNDNIIIVWFDYLPRTTFMADNFKNHSEFVTEQLSNNGAASFVSVANSCRAAVAWEDIDSRSLSQIYLRQYH